MREGEIPGRPVAPYQEPTFVLLPPVPTGRRFPRDPRAARAEVVGERRRSRRVSEVLRLGLRQATDRAGGPVGPPRAAAFVDLCQAFV